jgi:hypothetical protein
MGEICEREVENSKKNERDMRERKIKAMDFSY